MLHLNYVLIWDGAGTAQRERRPAVWRQQRGRGITRAADEPPQWDGINKQRVREGRGCSARAACFIIKSTFFNRKSGFFNRKSGFLIRKSGFFHWKLLTARKRPHCAELPGLPLRKHTQTLGQSTTTAVVVLVLVLVLQYALLLRIGVDTARMGKSNRNY